ncbi:hypothetical protein HXX76_012000 [Chlamydomonas incerta]|uniref:WSC domain-containing protein n=1 Tax=Chlamydomonas incerta TaxID=51695 RepID=A0A835STK1_CHLIN|nr:hypothetical protein HXX76_012000 [Chlamydomonas incerta]|eukprot:KAG2428014.1 hypothetical protein HXX76_012000 [Chlamydomonas incerta]
MQAGGYCLGGNVLSYALSLGPGAACNMTCTGNEDQVCGGSLSNSMYAVIAAFTTTQTANSTCTIGSNFATLSSSGSTCTNRPIYTISSTRHAFTTVTSSKYAFTAISITQSAIATYSS